MPDERPQLSNHDIESNLQAARRKRDGLRDKATKAVFQTTGEVGETLAVVRDATTGMPVLLDAPDYTAGNAANLEMAQVSTEIDALTDMRVQFAAVNERVIGNLADRANVSVDRMTAVRMERLTTRGRFLAVRPLKDASEMDILVPPGYRALLASGDSSLRGAAPANAAEVSTNANAGYAVVGTEAEELLKQYNLDFFVSSLVDTRTVRHGRRHAWVTLNETGQSAEWLNEGDAASERTAAVTQQLLTLGRVSSKVQAFSRELDEDNEFQFAANVEEALMRAIMVLISQAIIRTTGTATKAHVNSVWEAVGTGKAARGGIADFTTSANTGFSIADAFAAMLTLDGENERQSTWVMRGAQQNRFYLSQAGTGGPLYYMGIGPNGGPGMLAGRPMFRDDSLAAFASGAKVAILANMRNYALRFVRDLAFYRFAAESDYATRNMVGILIQGRVGGQWLGPNKGGVRITIKA